MTADSIAIDIHDLTHDGKGVADIDGRRIFVAGALPAERVLIAPRRRRRRYQEAELLSVVDPADARVEAGCEYFGRCGGCAIQHMNYDAQLAFKQDVVAQAFTRIAGVEPEVWLDPVPSKQWNYRRRARLGVRYVAGKQRVLVGFRERAAAYVTDMTHCPVLAAPLSGVLGELADVIGASSLKSRLPQVEVSVGEQSAAIILRVLDSPTESDVQAFRAFGERHTLDVYLQPGGPGTVHAITDDPRTLSYSLADFDIQLQFAPTDFLQVNADINARIVATVIETAELESTDRVLDLFCGLGNFSLPIARNVQSVLGVEGEGGLVARAAKNAQLNAIENARFVTADLSQPDWAFLRDEWDVVILDPPRTGAEAVVEQMAKMAPRRILYVSCHPATLARDAKVLYETQAYRARSAQIFDMFPHTHHVEVVTMFERQP